MSEQRKDFWNWQFGAWRQDAEPKWQAILQEAEAAGDVARAEYARGVLGLLNGQNRKESHEQQG